MSGSPFSLQVSFSTVKCRATAVVTLGTNAIKIGQEVGEVLGLPGHYGGLPVLPRKRVKCLAQSLPCAITFASACTLDAESRQISVAADTFKG